MTYQDTFSDPPPDSGDEVEQVVRHWDRLIRHSTSISEKHLAAIERLRAAECEEVERRTLMISYREEARALLGAPSRLRAVLDLARQHGMGSQSTPPPPGTPGTGPYPGDTEPESPAPEEPEARAAGPETTEGASVITIRSKRQQEILNVMAQRPDQRWSSEDLARALGIPQEPRARKSLRNTLRALTDSGALERLTREGDRHVYYRPRMNWNFA